MALADSVDTNTSDLGPSDTSTMQVAYWKNWITGQYECHGDMNSYHPFILHCGSPLNPLFAEVVLLTEFSKNVTWGNFYAIHPTKCLLSAWFSGIKAYLLYIYVCTSCINAKIRYNWLKGKGCFNLPLPLCLWQNASCDNIFVKNSAQYKLQIIEPPWLDTVISLKDNWSAMGELITVSW